MPAHYSQECNHKDAWELTIKAHPYFAKKYHHFYDDHKHRIASHESLKWLTPNGLANWYMCDGYVCLVGKTKGVIKDRRIDICTDRYSQSTIQAMITSLEKQFQLKFSMVKRGKMYRIRLKTSCYQRFWELIHPYIVESMKYKLYLGYEKQPTWMSDDMWQYQIDLRSAITHTAEAAG